MTREEEILKLIDKLYNHIKNKVMEEKGTLMQIDLTRETSKTEEIEVILGDYEFVLKDGKTYFIKKQPQYPKTYEECCEILGICSGETLQYGDLSIAYDYEFSLCMLLENLRKLLICRDAYWKIAGENMGLGKPWEPDWLNTEQDKFVLYTHDDAICLNCFVLCHNVLAFPTAEMRDAFLENFKELIELVKEIL